MQSVSRALMESLEQGQVIQYQYIPEDGSEATTHTGTVAKSNPGGIRVLPHGSHVRRIHTLKSGSVQSKHRDGGAARLSRKLGHSPQVEQTGETAGIQYQQRKGWVHVEADA